MLPSSGWVNVTRFLPIADVRSLYVFRADVWESYWRERNPQRVLNYRIACEVREKNLETVYSMTRLLNHCPSVHERALLEAISILAPGMWPFMLNVDVKLAWRMQRGLKRRREPLSDCTECTLPRDNSRWPFRMAQAAGGRMRRLCL